jgi:hypothetical protein
MASGHFPISTLWLPQTHRLMGAISILS